MCDVAICCSRFPKQLKRGADELGFPEDQAVNIFGAHDPAYKFKEYSAAARAEVRRQLGLEKPFILYNGGLELTKT